MLTTNRIFLYVFLQIILGVMILQWMSIQTALVALSKATGKDFVCRGTPKEGDKYTPPPNRANTETPVNAEGEIKMNLTDLVCRKIDVIKEGPSLYTHRCKFVQERVGI